MKKALVILALATICLVAFGCSPQSSVSSLKEKQVGDIVQFGNYQQSASGDKSPIEWRVLAIDGDKYLLLTDKAIDTVQYNKTNYSTTWEKCDLRKWLNESFYNDAFNENEKKVIQPTLVSTPDDLKHGTSGGENTQDHLFCLSIEELTKHLPSDKDRTCTATEYAVKQGILVAPDTGTSMWWLRSPGDGQTGVCDVTTMGFYVHGKDNITNGQIGVRPAMWVSVK